LLQELVQPLPPRSPCLVLRRKLLVLERNAKAFRQPFDRAGEVEILGLANEPDHVTAGAAAVAVVDALPGVDVEARRALLVERAEPAVLRALLPKLRACGDDVGDV